MEARGAMLLLGGLIVGILLQILGCVLFHNWWPMLAAIMYVLVPMPWMLFGTDAASVGGSDVQGWVDAGKFLTGMSAVGTIAIPTILFHAGKIVGGALACELLSAVVLGAVAIAYLNMSDSNDYMSW